MRNDQSGQQAQKQNQLLNADGQGVYIANPSWRINTSGIGPPDPGVALTYMRQTNESDPMSPAWLDWGAQRASRRNCPAFHGYCLGITSVVIAILVSKGSQLPATTRVEQFTSGQAATGHTYTVLDRAAGSDANDWTTWGNDCVAVDPWYGLQTDTDPVKQVSDPADAAYFQHMATIGRMKSVRSFTVGERTMPVKLP